MGNRLARLATVGMAAMLAGSLFPLAVSATSEAASSQPWLPGIKDSATIDGPVLIQGRLVDEKGAGRGGQLQVVAWPTFKVLGALQIGDKVKTLTVGKASTDAAGNFALRVDPTVPIGEYMEPDGTVNYDLLGSSGTQSTVFSFPRRIDRTTTTGWVAPGRAALAGRAIPLTIALRLGPAIAADPSVVAPVPATDKNGLNCQPDVVATYDQRPDVVGEVYPGPHATGDFQYMSSSTSTLGVGLSVSGAYGSFSSSGTSSATSSSTIDYPTATANQLKVFQTTFQYKKFLTWAFNQPNLSCHPYRYEVRPTGWQGGVLGYNTVAPPAVTNNNCSPISVVPVTVTKNQAAAVTFSNGMQLGSVIGLDLSTSTGFSTNTSIAFRFTSPGQLCGTNTTWPTANRVVGR